jgi:hypothetical protein
MCQSSGLTCKTASPQQNCRSVSVCCVSMFVVVWGMHITYCAGQCNVCVCIVDASRILTIMVAIVVTAMLASRTAECPAHRMCQISGLTCMQEHQQQVSVSVRERVWGARRAGVGRVGGGGGGLQSVSGWLRNPDGNGGDCSHSNAGQANGGVPGCQISGLICNTAPTEHIHGQVCLCVCVSLCTVEVVESFLQINYTSIIMCNWCAGGCIREYPTQWHSPTRLQALKRLQALTEKIASQSTHNTAVPPPETPHASPTHLPLIYHTQHPPQCPELHLETCCFHRAAQQRTHPQQGLEQPPPPRSCAPGNL